MAIYLCRWPNGDFSIVNASTKTEAIELLDEWGNAERAFISRMADCMLDFRLADDGQFELANIGESMHETVMERCYPQLKEAVAAAEWDDEGLDYSAARQQKIREAVELERTRLWDSQPSPQEAETGIGREIQKQIDAPSVVVNRIVREAASKRLRTKEGEGKRPN
jgi:hypothetical protein